MAHPAPYAPEVIMSAFACAKTHSELRNATFKGARYLLNHYFPVSDGWVIKEHGALSSAIKLRRGQEIAVEDTFLFEVKERGSRTAHQYTLAANADSSDPAVVPAVAGTLQDEVRERMPPGVGCLAMMMVRENIAFFVYPGKPP